MADTIWAPDLTQFPGPKYLGLTRALREAIRAGDLAEGARVPTVRDLAWELRVTPGTVARAYQLATQEGLLAATVGRGTFVAARSPQLGPKEGIFLERDAAQVMGRLDLRAPQLPDVEQGVVFAEAMGRMSARLSGNALDWLDYPNQRAEAPLRAAVCDWVAGWDLGPLMADDVALSLGGQNAINLIFLCCLRGERPVVLTEELAYPGFRHAARLARAEVVAVAMDAEGMLPDALEAACRRHGPQILCLTAAAQNPTAASMSLERREAIVAIARAHDLQIVEDECYSVVTSTIPTLRALAPERVWHVGSLAKTVSAAVRFGYVICPPGMGNVLRLTAQHGFFALPRPVSDLVLEILTSGAAYEVRSRVQAEFADRLAQVVAVLGGQGLTWQPGLPIAWLRLPAGWRDTAFTRVAMADGVLVRAADEFSATHTRVPAAVRLALPGRASRAELQEGLGVLLRLLQEPPSECTV